jgi:putative N6-adenine-specific DNA methylase
MPQHNQEGPIIVKTFKGLEPLLVQELEALGARKVTQIVRGATFYGELEMLYKANLHCRTAMRVLKPIVQFNARTEEHLYEGVKKINWSKYLSVKDTLAVDSVVNSEFFNHSQYVALKTKDAIVDQFREREGDRPSVNVENPTVQVHIHIREHHVSVLLDSSGEPLYKRGYRVIGHDANLSEVLAAGMLMHAGFEGKRQLIDPFCGSGTILIEGAMIAANRAPGIYRKKFGFMSWKDFDKELWERLRKDAIKAEMPIQVPIFGSDILGRSMGLARSNVQEAGFENDITLKNKDFLELKAPITPGIMVSNPPYGQRLDVDDIQELYGKIGTHMKHGFPGWEAWLISSDFEALKNVGLRPTTKIPLYNGGIECKFQRYDLYDGSKRHGPVIETSDNGDEDHFLES